MLNWYYRDQWITIGVPKCAKKISPTLLHHQQPEQAGWIHALMFFTPNSDPTIWKSQQKSRPGNVFPIFYCPFLVHFYCCLSISSKQSGHFLNKAFLLTELPLTGYFLFFGPFSVNPRRLCLKIPVDQQFLKYSVWYQQPCHVQSHLNHHSSSFWCSVWTSADRSELLPCD